MAKPVVPRKLANRDVDEAIAHCLYEAGDQVALRFVDAFEGTYRHISRHPAGGSLLFAAELNLPRVRSWRLRRFPYFVFYVETEECIDVWRVVHGARDIPAWMQEADDGWYSARALSPAMTAVRTTPVLRHRVCGPLR